MSHDFSLSLQAAPPQPEACAIRTDVVFRQRKRPQHANGLPASVLLKSKLGGLPAYGAGWGSRIMGLNSLVCTLVDALRTRTYFLVRCLLYFRKPRRHFEDTYFTLAHSSFASNGTASDLAPYKSSPSLKRSDPW